MSAKPRRQRLPQEAVEATVTALSHEGRGIAHVGAETVFIDGALPGERVTFRYIARRRGIGEGTLVEVLEASPERVEPRCPHFGLCGGCSLQHLPPEAQLRFKEGVLREQFQRIGQVQPQSWLPLLEGPTWGYRRRARLAVRWVAKKGGAVVGFRERHSAYVAALEQCLVLDPRVGTRLRELGELIDGLSVRAQIPQIEVALGDEQAALAFRNLAPLSAADRERLIAFGKAHGFQIYQQPGNAETLERLWPAEAELTFRIPEFDVELAFRPNDFTQVNAEINRRMVARALELLAPQPTDRVLDLFCGLGNFTLPLARRAGHVVGVEGEAGLVERARANARRNGLDNVEFHVADLAAGVEGLPWMRQSYDKLLLDPPRSGAGELIPQIAQLKVPRIVYVSCNPATLARDAGLLVHNHRYRLRAAGVMDMFPHTAHVESIALFELAER